MTLRTATTDDVVDEPAATSTGEVAAQLQPRAVQYPRKPTLPGLTGIRSCLALSILLFHFTPPGLRWEAHPWVSLYPIIDIGYVFVSFFFLISGFILAYNYGSRPQPMNAVDFWMARFSRLYPVYVLTLLVSIPMLIVEFHVRSRVEFWQGAILTPLLLQGCFPMLATFWNTVTWTLSCEVMLYIAFPWLIRLRWPRKPTVLIAMILGFWLVGLIPHSIYILHNPDHLTHAVNRYDSSFYINFLKFTPLPYVCTFLAGLSLGRLHEMMPLTVRGRNILGIFGFGGAFFAAYHIAPHASYLLIHGGLLTPIFACIILSLSGPGVWASIFGIPPLVIVGSSTYALYLLHFNVFVLLQLHHVPERLHVAYFDPWISYVFVTLLAVGVRKYVEHPCQVAIGSWWKKKRAAQADRRAAAV
ncbi:MAG: acyltransferase [Bryocella sp.]